MPVRNARARFVTGSKIAATAGKMCAIDVRTAATFGKIAAIGCTTAACAIGWKIAGIASKTAAIVGKICGTAAKTAGTGVENLENWGPGDRRDLELWISAILRSPVL